MSQSDVRTVDYHAGGEPFRIVVEPPIRIIGKAVAEGRMFAISDPSIDGLPRMLWISGRESLHTRFCVFLLHPNTIGVLPADLHRRYRTSASASTAASNRVPAPTRPQSGVDRPGGQRPPGLHDGPDRGPHSPAPDE